MKHCLKAAAVSLASVFALSSCGYSPVAYQCSGETDGQARVARVTEVPVDGYASYTLKAHSFDLFGRVVGEKIEDGSSLLTLSEKADYFCRLGNFK